jgi:hypothetical protein
MDHSFYVYCEISGFFLICCGCGCGNDELLLCGAVKDQMQTRKTSSSALPQISTLEGVTVQDGEYRSMRRETNRLRPHCVKQYRQADGDSAKAMKNTLPTCFPRCKESITNNDDDNNNSNNDNSNSEKRIMIFSQLRSLFLCVL